MSYWAVACNQQEKLAYVTTCPGSPAGSPTFVATLSEWNGILGDPSVGDVYSINRGSDDPFCGQYTLSDPGGSLTSPTGYKFASVVDCDDANCAKQIFFFVPCTPPTACDEANRNVYTMAAYADTWQAQLPGAGSLNPNIPATYAGTWKFRMGENSAAICNKCIPANGLADDCDTWCGNLQPSEGSTAAICYENNIPGNFPVCECCDVDGDEIQFIDSTFPGVFTAQSDCNDLDCYEPCSPLKCESSVVKVVFEHTINCGNVGDAFVTSTGNSYLENLNCDGVPVCQTPMQFTGTVKRKDAWQIVIRFAAYLNFPNAVDQETDCQDDSVRTTLNLNGECLFIENVEINNFNDYDLDNPDSEPPPESIGEPSIHYQYKETKNDTEFCEGPTSTADDTRLFKGRFFWTGVQLNPDANHTVKITKSRGWTDTQTVPDSPCVEQDDRCHYHFEWTTDGLSFHGECEAEFTQPLGDTLEGFVPAEHKRGQVLSDDSSFGFRALNGDNGLVSGQYGCKSVGYIPDDANAIRCCTDIPVLNTFECSLFDETPHNLFFGSIANSVTQYCFANLFVTNDADLAGEFVQTNGFGGNLSLQAGSEGGTGVHLNYGPIPQDGYNETLKFPYGNGSSDSPFFYTDCWDRQASGTTQNSRQGSNNGGPNGFCFDNCGSAPEVVDVVQMGTGTLQPDGGGDADFVQSSPLQCDGKGQFEFKKEAAMTVLVTDRIISITEVSSLPGGC